VDLESLVQQGHGRPSFMQIAPPDGGRFEQDFGIGRIAA
jgi:hypothetical protein